ncbi:uncharacterized protein LOC124274678 isoform X1 [Haliotis rubra]|uniref:uncharacterized protein LOC124274678 isoform X1 n=2 Tax=Haliotis rubra TaxID=36100 RepID=UPI001EE5584D|nr:uncharacterized protein LOC124274678 isoform X1 [Haliotis rubra]
MEKHVKSYSQIYAGNWSHGPHVVSRRTRVPPLVNLTPRLRSLQHVETVGYPLYVIWDESPVSSDQGDDPPDNVTDEGGGKDVSPDPSSKRQAYRYNAPHRWKRALAPPDSPKMKRVLNRLSWSGENTSPPGQDVSRTSPVFCDSRDVANTLPKRRPCSASSVPVYEPPVLEKGRNGVENGGVGYDSPRMDMNGAGGSMNASCNAPGRPSCLYKQPRSVPSDFGSQTRRHDSFEGAQRDIADDSKHLRRSHSDNTTEASRYRKFDIVGESFDARYPWQRDVSVQCDMNYWKQYQKTAPPNSEFHSPGLIDKDNSLGSSMTNVCLRRRDNFANRGKPRPNSIGPIENSKFQNELARFRDGYTRRGRKSEPCLGLFQSPPPNRTRLPLVLSDDTGSVSDLESIMENPDDAGHTDLSRHTSFTSYDEDDGDSRYNGSELAAVTESSDDDRLDILPSPSISPQMWRSVEDYGNQSDSESSSENRNDRYKRADIAFVPIPNTRLRRRQPQRRLSSGSLTDGSETENEPSPPVARRGRRSAIFETKNCGDVSPTTLSPEVSPSNSCDEGDGASNIAERLRRRRSSVDLAMNIYPGDLLVQEHHKKLIKRNTIADFYAGRNGTTQQQQPPTTIAEAPGDARDSRKGRQPFSLLKLMKTRSKESLSQLGELLSKIKPSEFKDNHLAAYKNLHWSDLIASSDKQQECTSLSETERKRREAVWELFKSECVFLIDHLMVLKHCFMEPLKKLQVEGFLMFAEPQDIFGNLDELCYVSYTFCKDFLSALLKDMSCTEFGRTKVLIKAFQRFSAHSKDGAVYHTYCLNYTNALSYLEKLRQNAEFAEFEKWGQQDARCNRLQLSDLLVAPMQHCTKLPLLLNNIRKYTADELEKQQVTESLEKMENSLKQLEDKMKWVRNYERVQEIQQLVVWPAVTDLDPRVYIPECLKATLGKQPCEKLLACTKRQLMYEGQLALIETTKSVEVHIFVFDDILLITKMKKTPRKKQSVNEVNTKTPSSGQTDRCTYTVYRQPIALDRFNIHDVTSVDAAACGLKNIFVLVQFSRFQQIIGVYTLQASCESSKSTWLTQIREAKEKYGERETSRQNSFKENQDPRVETQVRSPRQMKRNTAMRRIHGKSRSMDAMFL